MTAKLTPFSIMWKQFTTVFLTGMFINPPTPPSTSALYHLVFLERLETEVEVKLDNPAASYFRLVA